MSNTTYVPLKNDLLMRLIDRYQERYPQAIDDVIEDFLDRTAEDFAEKRSFREGGYVWEQVELPPGTLLRTRYFDEWLVAELRDGKFHFGGEEYKSPAQVCNAMRGNKISNAWIMLQVKRPQDIDFKRAEKFRI